MSARREACAVSVQLAAARIPLAITPALTGASAGRQRQFDLAAAAGGAIYLYILSRELALTCFSVTVLLWAVALRYGAFTRKAQRAYQDGLAETNEVQPACLPVVALI